MWENQTLFINNNIEKNITDVQFTHSAQEQQIYNCDESDENKFLLSNKIQKFNSSTANVRLSALRSLRLIWKYAIESASASTAHNDS